jgi:hypothetical protein
VIRETDDRKVQWCQSLVEKYWGEEKGRDERVFKEFSEFVQLVNNELQAGTDL